MLHTNEHNGKPDLIEERYKARRETWNHEATPTLWPKDRTGIMARREQLADWMIRETADLPWRMPQPIRHGVYPSRMQVRWWWPAIRPTRKHDILEVSQGSEPGKRTLCGHLGRPRFEATVEQLRRWILDGAPAGTVKSVARTRGGAL